MENHQEQRPIAYSYVRFSTAKQELGDSLRRQVEMAQDYCAEHNLDLHQYTYRDLGVSAFKRKNLEKGALAAFIQGVKSGKIAKGSYLVIEQFDRMSRAETSTALQLLLDLVKSGIKVVTLSDGKVWDDDSINDTGNLVLAIVYMSRANNESQAKADRLSSIWSQKKKRAADGTAQRIITSECPRWLSPNADKTGFVVLEDKVESIKKVFAMRIAGHGIVSIMRRANQEQWPVPGKSAVQKSGESPADFKARAERSGVVWHESLVGRLLKNRALLGEYLPHKNHPEDDGRRIPEIEPIAGYYPAVLDEETFLRAQAKADRSGRFPGRRDASLKNWLQGLLRCTCGNSFVRKNKDSQAQPGYARYYCSARNRGLKRPDGSVCPGANAGQLEAAILHVVSAVAPAFFEGTARINELKGRIELLEVEVSAARSTHERFLEAIAISPASVKSLTPRLETAAKALEDREREMRSARAELADLSGDSDTVFENIVKAIQNVDSLDARAALREDLSRIVNKVVVHEPAGYVQVFLRGQDNPVVQPLRQEAQLPTAQGGLQLGQMTKEEHAERFPDTYS